MKRIILNIFLTGVFCLPVFAEEVTVGSPDGKLRMKVYEQGGNVYYTVHFDEKPIVLESLLGINGNGEWKNGMTVGSSEVSSVDETWKPVYGERSLVRDRYNQAEIVLTQAQNTRRTLRLIVRAYNEGIAFRYFFPGNDYLHITDEYTQYAMPEGAKAYFTRRAQAVYNLLPLKDWPDECERPLVLELHKDRMSCLLKPK